MLFKTLGTAAVALIGCSSASALSITYYTQFTGGAAGQPLGGIGGGLGVGFPFSGTVLGPITISDINFGDPNLNQPGDGPGPFFATGAAIWQPFGNAVEDNGYPNTFAADVVGSISTPSSGQYLLSLTSDDGAELFINGALAIDDSGSHGSYTMTDLFSMTAGTQYDIEIQYFNSSGGPAYLNLALPTGVTYGDSDSGVPDGGSTAMLLSAALSAITLLRKKFIA